MSFDIWFHSGELLTLVVAGARVIRAANRVLDVMKDFPPHRHVNGHVIYPEGYPPAPIEELKCKEASSPRHAPRQAGAGGVFHGKPGQVDC